MNQRNIVASLLLCFTSYIAKAQYVEVTYEHEEDIMHQFTVMEDGANSLSPAWYYNLFHKSYQKDAANRNKLLYRTEMNVMAMQEKKPAAEIDSDYVARAKIEALNIESRSRAMDVTYAVEKSKINGKMELFQRNVNKILSSGGTSNDYRYWKYLYSCFENAILYIKESYLVLGQRKKEFMAIYNDITRRNAILVQQIYLWRNGDRAKEFLESGTASIRPNRKNIAYSAKTRWEAVWCVSGFSDRNGKNKRKE